MVEKKNETLTGILSITESPDSEFEAYGYPATFGGISEFIKASIHDGWPVNSPKQPFRDMLDWLHRKADEITGTPDSRHYHEKLEALENFRISLTNCLAAIEENEPSEKDKMLMFKFFEAGLHCGIMATLRGESFLFMQDELHSKKCAKGLDKRWAEDREDYEAAKSEALEYWKSGGTDYHHVVAKKLAKDHILSPQTLKKKLIPIAEPFGKVFGYKKESSG